MIKAINLNKQLVIFDLEKEQPQIRFALAIDWGPAPESMQERHWALKVAWHEAILLTSDQYANDEKLYAELRKELVI